jgi:hypothetical protein
MWVVFVCLLKMGKLNCVLVEHADHIARLCLDMNFLDLLPCADGGCILLLGEILDLVRLFGLRSQIDGSG